MTKYLSKWYIYLSVIAVVIASFCIAVGVKVAPKEHERVDFFIGANNAKVSEIENKLNENLPEGIVTVSPKFHYVDADNFNYIFSSYKETVDFYILPMNFVRDNKSLATGSAQNLDRSVEYLNSYLGKTLEYCTFPDSDMKTYVKGFKVYDYIKDEGILKNYITYNLPETKVEEKSDYYLFFNFKSINCGEVNNNSKTDNALKIIKRMFEYETL